MAAFQTTPARYTTVAKILHWLIALGIIAMLAIGWIMTSMPNGGDKFALFQLHKSIGITILLLAVLRLTWRLWHPVPELPATMPGWEKRAAKAGHFLLYVLMITMPVLGWIMVSTSSLNLPTILYGIIPWPHLPVLPALANKKEIGHLAGDAHSFLAWVIAIAVALHAAAALKHHFIDKDDVLTRMTPEFLNRLLNRLRGRS